MTEEWKDIQGYEGLYQVSNLGRVRSLDHIVSAISKWGTPQTYLSKGRIRKGVPSSKGYPQVLLSKEGTVTTHPIHRLVAVAFIPNPDNLPEVNHKNEDKSDSRASNLEWCTRDYNAHYLNACTRHAHKIWRKVKQFTVDGKFVVEHSSVSAAAKANGISISYVSKVIHGVVDSVKGYRFELI